MNFIRYHAGARPGAQITIPLKPINEDKCPAFKEQAWLFQIVHKVRALCVCVLRFKTILRTSLGSLLRV